VAASRIDGEPAAQPSCWANSEEGRFCLVCRRTRAGEAAVERAPAGSSPEEALRIRRTGLIEFEMRRSPDQLNRSIATACHTSAMTVAAVRRRLESTEG
jgi:hypothetical protein